MQRSNRNRAFEGHFVMALVSAFALPAAASTWQPSCDETRAGQYVFANLGGSPSRPVLISLCADIRCADKRALASIREDTYRIPIPNGVARPYFLIQRHERNNAVTGVLISARRLVLQGAFNFRDLGGYVTKDGRRTRWGRVFRSDQLSELTAADYNRLNAIGISLVCDLRERDERKSAPENWIAGSPVVVLAPVSEDAKGNGAEGGSQLAKDLGNALSRHELPIETRKAAFEKAYEEIALDSADKYGAAIRAIETWQGPSVFHCVGGRDRTGIMAALLLRILGVPQGTIMDDWLLSTKYLGERDKESASKSLSEDEQVSAEVYRLQPRYLNSVFSAIDDRYGDFGRYRRDALKITDADVQRLKARLLE
jgi:protein-tyrosine phosphatase